MSALISRGVPIVLGLTLAFGARVALADGAAACREGSDVAILASPAEPSVGRPLRIVVAVDEGGPGEVGVVGPGGRAADVELVTHGGAPWSAVATVMQPMAGSYRLTLRREGADVACRDVLVVGPSTGAPSRLAHGSAWPSRLEWSRKTEALYAAWVEHLFDAPPEAELSFPTLEPVLRDPARNFLHDHLGLGEDGPGPRALSATPDCADLPYLLRAYFAWKLGLPFGFRRCTRGSPDAPPRCGTMVTNEDSAAGGDALAAFARFARTLADGVHSGSARTALDDDHTDFYPVSLTRAAIRPGTIYADPYGHTLVVVGWLAQTPERPGLLHAVDAQPDDTVGRKRFWEGTFLFAADDPSAGPGFKAFRPIVHDGAAGRARTLTNRELEDDPRFTPWAGEQAELEPEAFYARLGALVNPHGLEPERAYEATLDALVEQLEARVRSIDNAERFHDEHPGVVIPMPQGARIFEATGAWEDYSTPARDLRLMVAMNVLAGLPERIVRHPELFTLNGRAPEAVREEVARLHGRRTAERHVSYTRSDGSPWRLTVADLLDRRRALEMGYNPNDCVERRWGAAEDSPEASTCVRHAPAEQRTRMESYRDWFREGRRPPRP